MNPRLVAIAKRARQGAEGKGAQVPQRVQEAGAALQFLQALLAPGQMIDFLGGGFVHGRLHRRIACGKGLTLVQGLGGDLSGMVDPHQAHRFCALGRRQGLSQGRLAECRAAAAPARLRS